MDPFCKPKEDNVVSTLPALSFLLCASAGPIGLFSTGVTHAFLAQNRSSGYGHGLQITPMFQASANTSAMFDYLEPNLASFASVRPLFATLAIADVQPYSASIHEQCASLHEVHKMKCVAPRRKHLVLECALFIEESLTSMQPRSKTKCIFWNSPNKSV